MEDKIFHYTFSELRRFIELGRKEGNVGMIPISITNNIIKYKGFGTIDNPTTIMNTMSLMYDDIFDSCNRNVRIEKIDSYSYQILDFNLIKNE